MDTGLKHTLKEEFCVYRKNSDGDREYIQSIQSSYVNTTSNIDNAMKLKKLEGANASCALAKIMEPSKEYKICHISTTIEDVENTDIA